MYDYRIEMKHGQDMRTVRADSFESTDDGWLVFFKRPGLTDIEYWRVRLESVVSMETVRG